MKHLVLLPLALALSLSVAACATSRSIAPQVAPASVDFANAQRVEVVLDDFSFAPNTLHLVAGRPMVLALTSASGGGHNFAAPGFFEAAQVAASDAVVIADGKVEVAGGQTVEIRLVPAAGGYDLDCTHLGHSVLGMSGSIVVR
ncbi:MAG: plastocyanin/azurin family copper-binding protein [Alteraurantiacibacter sp.]